MPSEEKNLSLKAHIIQGSVTEAASNSRFEATDKYLISCFSLFSFFGIQWSFNQDLSVLSIVRCLTNHLLNYSICPLGKDQIMNEKSGKKQHRSHYCRLPFKFFWTHQEHLWRLTRLFKHGILVFRWNHLCSILCSLPLVLAPSKNTWLDPLCILLSGVCTHWWDFFPTCWATSSSSWTVWWPC